MDQCDSSASDEPDEVQHPWPYLASMFRIKSIDGSQSKLTCLLCLPLHVECSAYATSPSNLRKHVEVRNRICYGRYAHSSHSQS